MIIYQEKKRKNNVYKNVYPNSRHFMSLGRKGHQLVMNAQSMFNKRPESSKVLPDAYAVCNTSAIDSDYDLKLIEGLYPDGLGGNFYLCQCLGVHGAFLVGDTNIVKINFDNSKAHLTNRLMRNPAALSRLILDKTRHRFDYFGLMFLSPGLGMFSYTEGYAL